MNHEPIAGPSRSTASAEFRSTDPIAKEKKANPLTDLIDTEHEYIENMSKIIRKVAAAWSKHNFPPKQLDRLFRAVEACFRANKTLLAQLDEIGPNPSSPKALGDLLMRWVTDIEPSYTVYASAYRSGFDDFAPILSNQKLPAILEEMPTGLKSLDSLFKMPYNRLIYYKRLYAKLLRSTTEGRSDHRQLSLANSTLESLITRCESMLEVQVASENSEDQTSRTSDSPPPSLSPSAIEGESTTLPRYSNAAQTVLGKSMPPLPFASSDPPDLRLSQPTTPPAHHSDVFRQRTPSPLRTTTANDIARVSPQPYSTTLGSPRVSSWNQTASHDSRSSFNSQDASPLKTTSSFDRSNVNPVKGQSTSLSGIRNSSVEQLETRLDTSRALDVFTLKAKKCRLQINPPGLSYSRSIRYDADVSLFFQLSHGTAQDSHLSVSNGHIFLLTDLFLVCEHKAQPADHHTDSSDLWLLFPPLAGKHLSIQVPDSDPEGKSFHVAIMKREVLEVSCANRSERDMWLVHFGNCINFNSRLPNPPLASVDNEGPDFERARRAISTMTIVPPSGSVLTPPVASPLPISPIGSSSSEPRSPSTLSTRSPRLDHAPRLDAPLYPQQMHNWNIDTAPPRPDFANGLSHSGPVHHPKPSQSNPGPFDARREPSPGISQTSLPPGASSRSFSPPPSMHLTRSQGHMQDPSGAHYLHQGMSYPSLRKNSSRSTGSLREYGHNFDARQAPPLPSNSSHMSLDAMRGSLSIAAGRSGLPELSSSGRSSFSRTTLSQPGSRTPSYAVMDDFLDGDVSPPATPVKNDGPVKNQLIAQMKCKVFLQTNHQQWKALGTAKLTLYLQHPGSGKQLVCQAENKEKSVLISTMVLSDGVERMGKTGVAIELSDQGARTGIIYMLQLKTEQSATGLFNELLKGSDRKSSAA